VSRLSKFDRALPRRYPGCWKNSEFRRRYDAAWMARKRARDADYYEAELSQQAAHNVLVRACRRAKLRRLARRRRIFKIHRMREIPPALPRCYFCGVPQGKLSDGCDERARLRIVERMVVAPSGKLLPAKVLWCGKC
jgi:hypothetical protein